MSEKDERRKKQKPCAYCGKIFRTRKARCCSRDCFARLARGQKARIENGVGIIPLNKGAVVIVDEQDFARVNLHVWTLRVSANGNRYADRIVRTHNGGSRTELMHRFILGLTDPAIHTDHKDGDGLNNRRQNIRACVLADNAKNRRKIRPKLSRFKGVTTRTGKQFWIARIRVAKKLIHIGNYPTEEQAALAYNEAAKQYFGEFAKLNDVSGELGPRNKRAGYNKTRRRNARALAQLR